MSPFIDVSYYSRITIPKMKLRSYFLLLVSLILVGSLSLSVKPVKAEPDQQAPGHSPKDLIAAVNQLRLENGLPALSSHPSLMEVAQWEADAIAAGAPGHTRPPGLTLGAWMISLGYPLAGNIALDGYRSENWAAGSELTVDETIQLWLGDAPHTNTMLSPERSDIGAGVALGEDPWGNIVYYYVIETALQTSSGQMQPDAVILLTSLPETLQPLYSDGTQAASAASVSQYMVPVVLATARPDGDVVHRVRNGQSLWSIAIAYGVKINGIKLLNNLTSNEVYIGQQLLVQKGATQPVFSPTLESSPTASQTTSPHGATLTKTPLPNAESATSLLNPGINPTLIMFLIVVTSVLGPVAVIVVKAFRSRNSNM